MRNRIAHGYFDINLDVVRDTVVALLGAWLDCLANRAYRRCSLSSAESRVSPIFFVRFQMKIIRLAIFSALLLMQQGGAHAATSILGFSSLPSAQGWTYVSDTLTPEGEAFAVIAGILAMDSTTANAAYYVLPGALTANQPFEVSARIRVFDGIGLEWMHLYAETNTHAAAVGFGFDHIVGLSSNSDWMVVASGLDNTKFQDIRLQGIAGVSANVYLDNVFIAAIPFVLRSDGGVAFGDGGGTGGGRAEIASFSISSVPEPMAQSMILAGLLCLAVLCRHAKTPLVSRRVV